MVKKIVLALFCLLITVPMSSALGADFIPLDKKDKCPVCGMFVAKYKPWVAQIVFTNNDYRVFDGCKDMFKYYFKMKKYERKFTKEDIAEIYVTEYYGTKVVNVTDPDLYFVIGSDVLGPMGHELVPVLGERDAKIFKLDHGGKNIYKFNEITLDVIPR